MDWKPRLWNHDFPHLVCICKQREHHTHGQSKLLTISGLQNVAESKVYSPSTDTQAADATTLQRYSQIL